jgi:SOS regulatory protein LexA
MLTKKQKQILNYIATYIKANDYAPSLEEIKKHFRLSSVSTVHQHIENLRAKDYLNKIENQPRSIELNDKKKGVNLITVPLLGTIAAGKPIEAIENPETIEMPKNQLSKPGKHYALRVNGDSMINEGISDGDIVVIRKQPTAENGETVVALLNDNEVTLKKIYREENGFRLQPANPNLKPIFTKKLAIQGKVITVIRKFEELKKLKSTEAKKNKIEKERESEPYLNKVELGDIMDLLKKLPDKCVDMIFGDPDYNVGIKYGEKTYTKNFDEYIDWYIELAKESMRILKNEGNFFMMNYPKQNAHLRVKYLDNVYPLVNEYVWIYNTNVGHTPKRFTTAHRTILHVRKTEKNKFYKDNVAMPYKNPIDRRILNNLKNGSKGRMPYDWFYFDLVKNVSKEKTYHACQIPQKLTEMLIKSCTMPNDVVLILFGGSGSELEVCKLLKRQYISAEIDPKYYELILSRLKNGKIEEKYKLQLTKNRKEKESSSLQLF